MILFLGGEACGEGKVTKWPSASIRDEVTERRGTLLPLLLLLLLLPLPLPPLPPPLLLLLPPPLPPLLLLPPPPPLSTVTSFKGSHVTLNAQAWRTPWPPYLLICHNFSFREGNVTYKHTHARSHSSVTPRQSSCGGTGR